MSEQQPPEPDEGSSESGTDATSKPDRDDPGEAKHQVELIADGDNLLVLGSSKRVVRAFLKAQGIVEKANPLDDKRVVLLLKKSAEYAKRAADVSRESGLWVKLTPESAEAIKEFKLVNTDVPGIVYAMAGDRGSLKKWLKLDASASALASNPVVLSGLAGELSQEAFAREAAELRRLLETLDHKVDKVLQGQRDLIFGNLEGIESEVKGALLSMKLDGSVDGLTWSKLAGASLQVRQVRAQAVRRLVRIAEELEDQGTIRDLNEVLKHTRNEVHQWLAAISRCEITIDELARLELSHYALVAPDQVNTKRLALRAAREEDLAQLSQGVAALLQRMDKAADDANQHKILHVLAVPQAIRTIEQAKGAVGDYFEALGIEIDWTNVDPVKWLEAMRHWQQWRNAGHEAGALGVKVGKPVLKFVAVTATAYVVKEVVPIAKEKALPVVKQLLKLK